jgi:hypothetical protein
MCLATAIRFDTMNVLRRPRVGLMCVAVLAAASWVATRDDFLGWLFASPPRVSTEAGTKINLPPQRAGLVARPRLLGLLPHPEDGAGWARRRRAGAQHGRSVSLAGGRQRSVK